MAQDNKGTIPSDKDAAPWTKFFPFPAGQSLSTVPDFQKLLMVGPHMQAAMLKAAIDQQKALFGFLQQRCDQDMKFAQKIGSAASIGEVVSASLSFCQEAAVDYAAQASRAAEISAQGTIEVAHDLEQERAEVLAPVERARAAA